MGGWKEKETSKQIEIIEGPRLRPASTQSIIARSKIWAGWERCDLSRRHLGDRGVFGWIKRLGRSISQAVWPSLGDFPAAPSATPSRNVSMGSTAEKIQRSTEIWAMLLLSPARRGWENVHLHGDRCGLVWLDARRTFSQVEMASISV